MGSGDRWEHGAGTWGGFRGQVGTTHSGPFYSEATHPSDIFMLFLGEYLLFKLFKLLTGAENSATALSTLVFQSRRVRSQRSKVAISLEFPSGCV